MNPNDPVPDAKDEQQIASVLAASEADAAPPDAEVLAKLRAQSTEAFSAASSQPVPISERKPSMFIRKARWLGAAAAAVIVGAGLYFWLAPEASAVTLGQVLENVEKADTLHVRFNQSGQKVEFWHSSQPKRSRWDYPSGEYGVSDGATLWLVNERMNEARRSNLSAEKNVLYHQFLDGLGIGIGDESALFLKARPVERLRDDGQDVLVYRTEWPVPPVPIAKICVEALVIAKTQRLHSIRTWLEKNGKITPIGDLTVLAYDEPIAAEKFVVADTLTEDGRIGKVTDVQGIVSIKPVLHERWTPIREGLVLRPGDWVRTDARGANATALRLAKQTGVILGPKTLVELIGPKQVRLIEGEAEITPTAGTTIELLGPGLQKIIVKGKQFYRVEKQQLAQVQKDPPWLLGFKGATANEALGSLVALVDGRNVPLTVGYHKVTVDIRDQIARTVIEESFVNHTNAVLEGVFYFPLPQDASISGFGMWIGDNLIEADVVEKQRAREIYEQFIREKRDPGLLEWNGGNIFKARVFPINANSEKRIKITYTQVLPLKGNRYRYSYALQSELLQQHPLRELAIDVKVNSVVPLKSVTSPTHPTRDEKTPHSAHVEFTAQEYTPTRDFEVVVEVEGRQADVVMIPHRRGDDGYFMLQLTPPGADGNWDRPLLANGDPVNLLILADTSASIDAGQRATQATFIGALLASLTPKDAFNLAVCDVTSDWVFAKPTAADANNVSTARDFLTKRNSLGWTDLDNAFVSALKQCDAKTHVIYVGDGIVTTGDADPVAFTKRLRRLLLPSPPGRGAGGEGVRGATFHAVTLGSSYEPAVLKAIASMGGGSMRKITSEQGPTMVARELLGEIAQPALRDVKVEFKGFKAARVYPESLANIPAGSQQILLGRYLPDGKDQSGEVIVTGTQAGKEVRFTTRASFKDAEQGNSFIPRLWARMHLDSLLEQGSSDAIKDEIIALSEEFQIITPYTSLLVLETDADRERFKVKRRFQMRNGERFFADGRDNAVFDLAQKQMKKAGNWRTTLRRSVLSELARLGREPRLFQPASSPQNILSRAVNSLEYSESLNEPMGMPAGSAGSIYLGDFRALGNDEFDGDLKLRLKDGGELDLLGADDAQKSEWGIDGLRMRFNVEDATPAEGKFAERMEAESFGSNLKAAFVMPQSESFFARLGTELSPDFGFRLNGKDRSRLDRGTNTYYGQWLNTLFPPLQGAPGKTKELKSTWPVAARDLAKSLLRTERLAKMTDGIEIIRQTETFDARWGELTGRSRILELVSAKSWLTRSANDGGQTIVSWCDAKEIGIFSKAFQLGRVRASTPTDVQPPPLGLSDHSLTSLEQTFATYKPTLEPQGKDRVLLVLKHPTSPEYETRILIDTARHVILSTEDRHKDKVTLTTRFDDFAEAAGTWWAQQVETSDNQHKRRSLVKQTVKSLALDALEQQQKTELAVRAQVQFLHLPMPSVLEAKKAVAVGKAGFADHFVLMLHFERSQQWPRMLDHLAQAEKLSAGKPGMHWLRSAVLHDGRRHDELRQRYQQDAERLGGVGRPAPNTGPAPNTLADAYFLAEYIVGQSSGVLQANEMLTLLDVLEPLYKNQPMHVQARKNWEQMRVAHVAQTGRTDEEMRLRKQLAADYPRDYSLQQTYAHGLANSGDYPAAYAWLTRVLVKEAKWLEHEEERLRNTYTELLQQQGRYADLVKYLENEEDQNSASRSAYLQYLGALIKSDQIEKANALALRWLKEAQTPGKLSPATERRLDAAVNLMVGNWSNRIEERWLAPLAQAALFFARHETQFSTAEFILAPHHLQRTEEGPRVRQQLASILSAEIDKLPAEQIRRFVGWINTDDFEPGIWNKISAKVQQRWTSEKNDDVKHALGLALVNILSKQGEPKELLAFLRLQRQTGPEKHRAEYANELFDHLLAQPWTMEIEAEAFGLFDKLSTAEEPGPRLFSSVAALHRLTDRLLEARIAASTKLLDHPEKFTRTELHKKQEEIRRQARTDLADRLHKEASKHPKALAPWLIAESLYLDVSLDRNLKQATAEAWEFVGAGPPASGLGRETKPERRETKPEQGDQAIERALDEILRQRYLVTLANLAARKGAEPALVERLIKYFDRGIVTDAESNHWKLAKYRVLIALDRPKELENALKQWVRQDDADSYWRIAFGYLLAEQGRLPEAIREFEAVEAADELTPPAYLALADWYLVQNQREAHERAAAAVYKTMPERQLSQMIALKLQPWQRGEGHLPTELDKEVLRMFAVLFDKSVTPQNYLHMLQQFYQASHDFRLLANLPDAVIGHTAARVYPFVQGMQAVLDEVRDEATADEIVKRIAAVRPRAKTDVDKRALDLLEVMVERRAAEVQNQAGIHQQKALEALTRASKGNWSPGEPRLMADFLANLGKISQQQLADEQLKQLRWLRLGETARETLDSLHIAHRHALTLKGYKRSQEAIDMLQAELNEFQFGNKGVLPVTANEALGSFIGLLKDAGHFARGEKVLTAQLAHPIHAQQRRWLVERLNHLYHHALQKNGEVSLGKGPTLYKALNAKVQKDLAEPDPLLRYQLVELLCQVYRTAHEKKLPDVDADLKSFAFEIAPPLVKGLTNYHPTIVSTVAQTIRDLIGPRDGIVFLLDQIESEPRWLRYNNEDGWHRHGTTLGVWRKEAKDLGAVEGRLLKIVLRELRDNLETRAQLNRPLYHHQYAHRDGFWKEKAADFAKTAEDVLAERSKSGAAVQYIADYFYLGLEKPKRAIEILFIAHNQKLLDEDGQARLVDFLHRQDRHGESIALLQPLVERRPANLDYRVQLMHALFRTDRKMELLALLKQTDAFFHEKDRWGEQALRRLAHSTLLNELFEQSVAYSKELIPLHERTQPNRGVGNGTLASYYIDLANAYAGLKKTPEAVDAAGGAIVAWGNHIANRAQALDTLRQVLNRSPDLDAFVAHFDKQKQDGAIVRKAIGQVYHDRKEHAKAIKQLELAAALQPNDAEIYQLLVASYDDAGDKAGAVRQLLHAVQHSRRDLKLYQDLGKRYAEASQPKEAERAYTSIVEMLPTESESHAMLAEIREKQNRWSDAIQHWEQVARIRALEPTGLLKLAAAQIHEKQWDQAQETLRKLNSRSWPTRFGDVAHQVRMLQEQITKQRKA